MGPKLGLVTRTTLARCAKLYVTLRHCWKWRKISQISLIFCNQALRCNFSCTDLQKTKQCCDSIYGVLWSLLRVHTSWADRFTPLISKNQLDRFFLHYWVPSCLEYSLTGFEKTNTQISWTVAHGHVPVVATPRRCHHVVGLSFGVHYDQIYITNLQSTISGTFGT